MTGRYLIPVCKNGSYVSTHTCPLRVCSHLPLSTANAATFPDKRGQLIFFILSFRDSHHSILLAKRTSPLPSFLSDGFPTAFYDRSRMTGKYLIPFCKNRFSCLLILAPSVNLAVDTFLDKRGRLFCVSHFNIFCFYSYVFPLFRVCSCLPLSSTWRLTPSPCPGTAYGLHTFVYVTRQDVNSIYKKFDFFFPWCQLPPNSEGSAEPCEAIGACVCTQVRMSWQNKNTSAVILERWAEQE